MLVVVAALLAWVLSLLLKNPDENGGFRPVSIPGEDEEKRASDELLGKIDDRIDTLRKLIKQADSKIGEIKTNSFVLPAEFPLPSSGGNGHSKEPSYQTKKSAPEEADSSRKTRIIELCRRGYSPDEIARSVGAGRAEVDLVLRLAGFMK